MRTRFIPTLYLRAAVLLALAAGLSGLQAGVAPAARADCTHFAAQGACPVGIPDGSTSVTVNANGTITWNTGGISGPCCAAPSGTDTGAGLHNLGNEIGGSTTRQPWQDVTGEPVGASGGFPIVANPGELYPQHASGTAFGGTNVDCGLTGTCGADGYRPPPVTFGGCNGGNAACGFRPTSRAPGFNPYQSNQTSGLVDPFGGGGSFVDPRTGASEEVSSNPAEWSDKIKKAQALNGAYVNGQIKYPFLDPDWETKPVTDFNIDGGNSGTLTDPNARPFAGVSPVTATGNAATTQGGGILFGPRIDDVNPTKVEDYSGELFSGGIRTEITVTGTGFQTYDTPSLSVPLTNSVTPNVNPDMPRRSEPGAPGPYYVVNPATGERAYFGTPEQAGAAVSGSDNSGGGPADVSKAPGATGPTAPATSSAATENTPAPEPSIADALIQNVPPELRPPQVVRRRDGEILDVYVEANGQRHLIGSSSAAADRANAIVQAMNNGASFEEAQAAVRNQAAAAAQQAAPATPPPAPITGRPIGEIGEAAFGGQSYGRVEIITGPDGKPHAVGTGKYAGWDFGEAKQGSFGWRNEGGAWTPPPAGYAPPSPAAGVAAGDRTTILNQGTAANAAIYQPVVTR